MNCLIHCFTQIIIWISFSIVYTTSSQWAFSDWLILLSNASWWNNGRGCIGWLLNTFYNSNFLFYKLSLLIMNYIYLHYTCLVVEYIHTDFQCKHGIIFYNLVKGIQKLRCNSLETLPWFPILIICKQEQGEEIWGILVDSV